MGGKSLASVTGRPPYKSWRKAYRKTRARFEVLAEQNKRLFKTEMKLDSTAKRLREDLDALREIALEINDSTPGGIDVRRGRAPQIWPDGEQHAPAGEMLEDFAASYNFVLPRVPRRADGTIDEAALPEDLQVKDNPRWFSTEQEAEHLAKLDNGVVDDEDRHLAEMTPRELERVAELLNPLSQHNWLKAHRRLDGNVQEEQVAILAPQIKKSAKAKVAKGSPARDAHDENDHQHPPTQKKRPKEEKKTAAKKGGKRKRAGTEDGHEE
ncbi:hypothetical protein K470DRAFT_260937 [Piedraia hortae CBS 480.64]|uniref:INO80 complex subunit 3 N-terminal domain-containing protein n=1 Tax=Piedraia hortae CBS 480.64 TaxID=1314780 RepID=A0A6A7BR13_9PEZI|nr:hypothetical protein K470DRAFT_260937 [Piedraia hortae CBS 480.64]